MNYASIIPNLKLKIQNNGVHFQKNSGISHADIKKAKGRRYQNPNRSLEDLEDHLKTQCNNDWSPTTGAFFIAYSQECYNRVD